jgi:hypothetical protein
MILLSHSGAFLDSLSCSIDQKQDSSGIFKVEVLPNPESDGTRFVIRYSRKPWPDDWRHQIHYGKTTYGNFCTRSFPRDFSFAEWEKRGLCRVAVRNGGFAILWPPLVEKETSILPTVLLGTSLYLALIDLGNREIERLIAQLGSPQFAERQVASTRLQVTGVGALNQLRKAAVSAPDPEIRRRAEGILPVTADERAFGRIVGVWQEHRLTTNPDPRFAGWVSDNPCRAWSVFLVPEAAEPMYHHPFETNFLESQLNCGDERRRCIARDLLRFRQFPTVPRQVVPLDAPGTRFLIFIFDNSGNSNVGEKGSGVFFRAS